MFWFPEKYRVSQNFPPKYLQFWEAALLHILIIAFFFYLAQHCEVSENKSNNDFEIVLSDSSPIPNEEKVVKFDVSPAQPASDFITIEENLEVKNEISDANDNDAEKIVGEIYYSSSIRSHQGLKQEDQNDDWYYCLDCHR